MVISFTNNPEGFNLKAPQSPKGLECSFTQPMDQRSRTFSLSGKIVLESPSMVDILLGSMRPHEQMAERTCYFVKRIPSATMQERSRCHNRCDNEATLLAGEHMTLALLSPEWCNSVKSAYRSKELTPITTRLRVVDLTHTQLRSSLSCRKAGQSCRRTTPN